MLRASQELKLVGRGTEEGVKERIKEAPEVLPAGPEEETTAQADQDLAMTL